METGNTMLKTLWQSSSHSRASVVHPVVTGPLAAEVVASAQHGKRSVYCTLPAWAKAKIHSAVFTEYTLLLHHQEVKKSKAS